MFEIHFDGTEIGHAINRLFKAVVNKPEANQAVVDLAGTEDGNINVNKLFDIVMIYDQKTATVVTGHRASNELCRIVTDHALIINQPKQST